MSPGQVMGRVSQVAESGGRAEYLAPTHSDSGSARVETNRYTQPSPALPGLVRPGLVRRKQLGTCFTAE